MNPHYFYFINEGKCRIDQTSNLLEALIKQNESPTEFQIATILRELLIAL